MTNTEKKTIGSAIDEIIAALSGLDENTRSIAVKAACEHLGVDIGITSRVATVAQNSQIQGVAPIPEQAVPVLHPPRDIQDIRSLKDEKSPTNGIEMACLVAYYLENCAPEGEVSPDVTKTDLEKYFKQANFPLPKAVSQTLVDAKAAGYLDPVSKGRYKLNPVGHNLIVHSLPRKKK